MPEVPDVGAIAQQVKARIKHIEDRLKEHERLASELERLRDALTRLEGAARSRVSAGRRPAVKPAAAPGRVVTGKRAGGQAGERTRPAAKPAEGSTRTRAAKRAGAPARAPRGENKAKVLEALKDGPMTAGEIAKVTGIGAGTVSTMLNKMAKSGELDKAERGYTLPQSS
jgi:CRP-like cAMP-binding protein